jgi:hypothetical protein
MPIKLDATEAENGHVTSAIDENKVFPNAIRVLRCRLSRRYFTGRDWSHDPSDAEAYGNEMEVARACVSHNLREVELVLRSPITGAEFFSTKVR